MEYMTFYILIHKDNALSFRSEVVVQLLFLVKHWQFPKLPRRNSEERFIVRKWKQGQKLERAVQGTHTCPETPAAAIKMTS